MNVFKTHTLTAVPDLISQTCPSDGMGSPVPGSNSKLQARLFLQFSSVILWLSVVFIFFTVGFSSLKAAQVYVDAVGGIGGNTYNNVTNSLTDWWTTDDSASDNKWGLQTTVSADVSYNKNYYEIYTVESDIVLRTEITGLRPNSVYSGIRVYMIGRSASNAPFKWSLDASIDTVNWQTLIDFDDTGYSGNQVDGSNNGVGVSITSTLAEKRVWYPLPDSTTDAFGVLRIYIRKGLGANNRSRYDGVGFENTLQLIKPGQSDVLRYLVPNAGTSSSWNTLGFDASTWTAASDTSIGFDSDTNGATSFVPHFAVNLGNPAGSPASNPMYAINSCLYTRYSFNVTDKNAITGLLLKIKYEDGFVAWLNGVEVARGNFTGTPAYNSTTTARIETLAVVYSSIDIIALGLPALQNGYNVLAIQGINGSASSNDFLLAPILEATLSTVLSNPPVGVADAYSVNEDTILTVNVPGVLTNDSDPDAGTTLTASWSQLLLPPRGRFLWPPMARSCLPRPSTSTVPPRLPIVLPMAR